MNCKQSKEIKYQNANAGVEIQILIGLNNSWEMLDPGLEKLASGLTTRNSKLAPIVSGPIKNVTHCVYFLTTHLVSEVTHY